MAPVALIGDPARSNMLTALMSGKALTVSELAEEAGVTIQTASSHLSKLDAGGLLRPRKQGRPKYFSLSTDEVAHVLEGLIGLAAGAGHLRKRTGPKDAELREARVWLQPLGRRHGHADVRQPGRPRASCDRRWRSGPDRRRGCFFSLTSKSTSKP